MNIEEFSYEFNSVGAENLISKLRQMEYETNQLDKSVSQLSKRFGKLFDFFLQSSVPPAFIKLIADQAMIFSKQAAYLDKLSQTSGISAKNIQQLGYALYKFGGDTDVATKSLVSLKEKIDQLKELKNKGQEGLSDLFTIKRKYGLSLNGAEDPMTLLKQIAATMDKLSKDKQLKFAKALGLDDPTFLMVKKGIKSVEEELYKAQKYTLFDEKDIQTAVKFEDTIKEIGADIELVSKTFSFGALPQLQKFSDKIRAVTNYLSEHPEVVKGLGLVTFSAGLTGTIKLLGAIPTKFLAGTAAITAFGTAVGMANEELKRIEETGSKEGTLLGDLDNEGLKGTSKAIEQIWRMLSKFGEFRYIEGLKQLDGIFDKIIEADPERKDPLANILRSAKGIKKEIEETTAEIKDKLEKPLKQANEQVDNLVTEFKDSNLKENIDLAVNNVVDYANKVGKNLSQSYENIEDKDFSSESIKTELSYLYNKTKDEIVRLQSITESYVIEETKDIYNTFKTNFDNIYTYINQNSPTWIEEAKTVTKDLYDKIKKNISEFYSKYVSDNENIDQQKISKLKDDSVNNIKEFFTRTLDVLTTAFHELPEWAQDAIKSGLKSFLVTWLLTGGNTNSASIVGTYMATRTALNKKIEEGSEDAAILEPISNEMAKGWLRGKILSGGDESIAAKSAVTSAIDQIVSQLSESEIKDKNQILKFIADHKSAIQSTTSVYSVSSILKHWGLSDTASNTLGVAVGGSEYLIDKGIEKVKGIFNHLVDYLSSNKESIDKLNNTLKSNENFMKDLYDVLGMNPINTALPMSSSVLSSIQNDNVSNSNIVINNTMTVNGGNPKEVQNAVSNATTASLYRYHSMRNTADYVTVGTK